MERSKQQRDLDAMVARLRDAAGDRLHGVVLYGAAAHGQLFEGANSLYLLILLDDLAPTTLGRLRDAVRWWLDRGHPMPRMFTPEVIADASDVFPIELLEIAASHRVLTGGAPFAQLSIDTRHLRLQCERDLREKLMRLEEAYVESRGRDRDIERLIATSYLPFVDVFRGCLRLLGEQVPSETGDVIVRFCQWAGLEAAPFREAEQLARGERASLPIGDLFERYHTQLTAAVRAVDSFEGEAS